MRAASLTPAPWGRVRILEKRSLVSYKCLILLLGIFLGSHALAAAQTPAPQIVLAQEHVAPIIMMLRTVSTPLPVASFLVYRNPGKSTSDFSHLLAGAYERDHRLESLAPIVRIKTLIYTSSSLPLVQLWGGKLQLEAFQTTLRLQYVQLGPLGYDGMLDIRIPQQSYPGGPRSVHLSGLSLNFHFDRYGRTGYPFQAWASLPRIVGSVLY
jgi:hypothetical protein